MSNAYLEFLRAKHCVSPQAGFDIDESEVNPILKPHQRAMVVWAVRGGRRALFASFGLGKTVVQLECVRIVLERVGGRGLIVLPLGVRGEFMRDAAMLGTSVKFVRSVEECAETGIYLTNYETVRDGKLDPAHFRVASLDEAAILRGFGGTKTFREFMALFAGDRKDITGRTLTNAVPYRFVATATPSPNDYIELLAYAAFLGIMDVSGAKTRFFKRDSTKADKLTLHAHKADEFWMWVASWGLFIERPSDIGCDATGYELPPMSIEWHKVSPADVDGGVDRHGRARLFRDAALGVVEASREKRDSMALRVAEVMRIVRETPTDEQLIVWCDLNDEQHAIERSLLAEGITVASLFGSQDIDTREARLADWLGRSTRVFLSKPMMYGAGVNLQQAHTMIFAGIGFKFGDLIQAIHRVHRFLQANPVTIHLIYTEGEREIRRQLERKWQQHDTQRATMTAIIREYGLSEAAMAQALVRAVGVERVEISGERYRLVNNDCVVETRRMDESSIGLILTSIPFSTQYEYSPNYADFGHSDDNTHFFRQMDFLTPELLRVLQPGRIAAVHVKDRIVPGGMTGLGFQTVYPFHSVCIDHYVRHGFAYMGMKTIVTDVVRENNQTYRLGWTEQCKDGTKMGVGMPEYLLLFRKPPTDTSNSYADNPVVKSKARYTRSRWQIDAHGMARSSGNRILKPEELARLEHDHIFRLFRKYSLENVYDFEHHVRLNEGLEQVGRLPTTFMLLQPPSHNPDVWTDITRMLTLNGSQYAKGKEAHLCPMQFDLADRVIEQFTNEGEVVYDPFAGLGTVPLRAVLQNRIGVGTELSPAYFVDAASYLRAAEERMAMPTLFDVTGDLPAEAA